MPPTPAGKLPHNIDVMLRRIEKAVEPFAKAALFELADLGYSTPFEQLIACIISIRSLDEVTLPAAQRLFEVARTPAEVAALTTAKIDRLIHPATFHERKATQIQGIARLVAEKHNNELPCDRELMLSFPGVGPKCANLALGIACGSPSSASTSTSTGSPTAGVMSRRPLPRRLCWPWLTNCPRSTGST
jgi:endonuclease-3